MSILFADNFQGYGNDTSKMLDGLYAELAYSALVADPDTNATGNVYQTTLNAVGGTRMRRVLPANYTTAGFAFRMWRDQLYNHTLNIGFLNAASDYNQPSIQFDATGRILVRANNTPGSALLGQTTNPVLTAHAWSHIEVKYIAGNPTGSIEVRVNGVAVLTLMGINSGAQYSQFYINLADSAGVFEPWYFKDMVIWSGTGANNSFLGTVSVVSLVPNADVSLNWTPTGAANGWSILDNSPPDDVQYIAAPFPAPGAYVGEMSNLPVNVSTVRALITQVRARKQDGGDGNLQASLVSGGDTANGQDRPITTAFTYYEDVFEVDPHTAAPWTPGAVDLARLKLNRTL